MKLRILWKEIFKIFYKCWNPSKQGINLSQLLSSPKLENPWKLFTVGFTVLSKTTQLEKTIICLFSLTSSLDLQLLIFALIGPHQL